MRFDAVLFDFGGVFTDSPFDAVEDAGRELGAAPGELREIVFGPYHEDTDHPWHRLERGEVSLADAREAVISIGRSAGFEFEPFELLARSVGKGGARGEFVECARGLRERGFLTAMVTNNVREFGFGWRRMIPVDEIFDLVIDSSEVGVRKPDRRIYHLTLEQLGGIAPERTVFLDDFEGNLEAARDVGMHSVLVDADAERAIVDLERLLAESRAEGAGQ
jgi:putative hydrolase of the HAD superfamily